MMHQDTPEQIERDAQIKADRLADIRAEEMFNRHERPRYFSDNGQGQEAHEVERDNFNAAKNQ